MRLTGHLVAFRQLLAGVLAGEAARGRHGEYRLVFARRTVWRGVEHRQHFLVRLLAHFLEAADHGRHVEVRRQLLVRHFFTHRLEADAAVQHRGRAVAVQAGAGLRLLRDALGDALVVQHVGMPACFTVVDAEGIAGIQPLQVRLCIQLALGQRAAAAIELVARGRLPAVELARPVLAPGLGVGADLADLGHAYEGLARILLVAEHRDQHVGHEDRGDDRDHEHKAEQQDIPALLAGIPLLRSAAVPGGCFHHRGPRSMSSAGLHGRRRYGNARTTACRRRALPGAGR